MPTCSYNHQPGRTKRWWPLLFSRWLETQQINRMKATPELHLGQLHLSFSASRKIYGDGGYGYGYRSCAPKVCLPAGHRGP